MPRSCSLLFVDGDDREIAKRYRGEEWGERERCEKGGRESASQSSGQREQQQKTDVYQPVLKLEHCCIERVCKGHKPDKIKARNVVT